jgi:hypothetical protein
MYEFNKNVKAINKVILKHFKSIIIWNQAILVLISLKINLSERIGSKTRAAGL